jgi:molybdenum cofactor cytidylyltransferase
MIEASGVAVLLLAAGRSERFGRDKLLAKLDGVPVLLHAATRLAALETGWRIAVCREDSPLVEDLTALGFDVIVNPDPARGLSTSLALAAARAEAVGAEAALVALGDMPFVSLGHFRALLSAFDPAAAPVAASGRQGVAMPPAIFGREYFTALQKAKGDRGARDLLVDATRVAADPAELADIDRPEDIR